MRAMSSAIAGLKAMQTGIDVIGNNISNVNTQGYKASRTTYSDVYYQTLSSATAGSTNTKGGTNPYQVGYGSAAASVDVDTSRSGYDNTNSATDLYIDGEGYFIIGSGTLDGSGVPSSYLYTRVGNFKFDENGYLVDKQGNFVCGSNYASNAYVPVGDANGKVTSPVAIKVADYSDYKNVKIGSDGIITGEKSSTVTILGRVDVANIPNPAGLEQAGNSNYKATNGSGTATCYYAGLGPTGGLKPNALETSNVDLSTELANMITTQRGFQANSKIITVSDSMLEEIVNMKR